MSMFTSGEWSTEGEIDDVSDGDQVRQLQEQLRQKDNDMVAMIAQMKAMTAQLSLEGKILEATCSTSTQIQPEVLYSSKSSSLLCQQTSWHIFWGIVPK